MGKKSREPVSPTSRRERDIDRIFRKLAVPFGGDIQGVLHEAEVRLGPSRVQQWDERLADRMTLALEDIETAIVLGIGIRERLLRKELAWICQQISNVSEQTATVFEVGSGTAFTASCVQRLTGRKVIATDPVPEFEHVASQLAERIGARIDTGVCDISSARDFLDGKVPEIVLAQAVVVYAINSHKHQPGLSWPAALSVRFAQPENLGPDVSTLIDLPSRCLLVIDFFCPEVVGSLVGLAAQRGMWLNLEGTTTFTEMVYGEPVQQIALCFEAGEGRIFPDPVELLDKLNIGFSTATPYGMEYSDWQAERRFRALPLAEHAWHVETPGNEHLILLGRVGNQCYEYSTFVHGRRTLQLLDLNFYQTLLDDVTSAAEAGGGVKVVPGDAVRHASV